MRIVEVRSHRENRTCNDVLGLPLAGILACMNVPYIYYLALAGMFTAKVCSTMNGRPACVARHTFPRHCHTTLILRQFLCSIWFTYRSIPTTTSQLRKIHRVRKIRHGEIASLCLYPIMRARANIEKRGDALLSWPKDLPYALEVRPM